MNELKKSGGVMSFEPDEEVDEKGYIEYEVPPYYDDYNQDE